MVSGFRISPLELPNMVSGDDNPIDIFENF
jgi:hypothetical protein